MTVIVDRSVYFEQAAAGGGCSFGAVQKVCVVGAGAIGGGNGARLASAGVAVSGVAMNQTLASLRTHGWSSTSPDGERHAAPVATATDDPAALGPQDVVIIAVKAHHLPALAPTLAPLLAPDTVLIPALNGVPWWFFHD